MWVAVKRRMGLSRRGRDERGAVLVEAAIVIPILMMITLGIIEYGGAYREDSTVAAATRAGARVASALSKTDFGVTTGQTDSGVVTANAVASVLQSLGATAPQQIWIYQVNSSASCAPPTFSGCTYKIGYGNWSSTSKSFSTSLLPGSTAWPATKQSACAGGTIDQIGIWVTVNHTAVTRMFGPDGRSPDARSCASNPTSVTPAGRHERR